MGPKPAPGLMADHRFRLPRTFVWTAMLCLLAVGCSGPSKEGERPISSTQSMNGISAETPVAATPPIEAIPQKQIGRPIPEPQSPPPTAQEELPPSPQVGQPVIARAGSRMQCVPYARKRSGIAIRGDAWTWWKAARGHYHRGRVPLVGSVLVLKRRGRGRGHLAVVTHVLSNREIIVDHANWLNRGRIHRNTPVMDVSRKNDWSAVRVWHVPTRQLGVTTYRAYGFVYPEQRPALTSQLPTPPDRG